MGRTTRVALEHVAAVSPRCLFPVTANLDTESREAENNRSNRRLTQIDDPQIVQITSLDSLTGKEIRISLLYWAFSVRVLSLVEKICVHLR